MPRILPDGSRNAFHIQRLKDKLGNHSNASSEVEFHGAWARMVGEPGRGVPTIIEMVGHTRLDCVIGSAAGMRSGVACATHHAAHRSAFGKTLIDQPLMQQRARRPVHRVRGHDGAGDAPGARLRRSPGRRRRRRERDRRAAVQAPGHGRRQVLDLQARPQPRLRVARVPRRRRLRRGVGHAAPVPRGAAGVDLGGLGQRDEPRRAARADALAALARGLLCTRSSRRAAPTRAWTRAWTASRSSSATQPRSRPARGASSKTWPCACRARCSCATAPRARRRRLLRLAPGRRRRPRVRHAARRQRLRGDHRARRDPSVEPLDAGGAAAAPTISHAVRPSHELPAGAHLRHPRRRQRQLVRRPVRPHLLAHTDLPQPCSAARSTTAYLVAVASVLSLFASLVLHELGHALAARRIGMQVAGIDLWFFGGITDAPRVQGPR